MIEQLILTRGHGDQQKMYQLSMRTPGEDVILDNAGDTVGQEAVHIITNRTSEGYLLSWRRGEGVIHRKAVIGTQDGKVLNSDYEEIEGIEQIPVVEGEWGWLPFDGSIVTQPGLEGNLDEVGIDIDFIAERQGEEDAKEVEEWFSDSDKFTRRRNTFATAVRKIADTIEPDMKEKDLIIFV